MNSTKIGTGTFSLITLLFICLHTQGQYQSPVITFRGIGEIKTGMTISQLEHIVGKKIPVPVKNPDTVECIYKGVAMDVILFTYGYGYFIDEMITKNSAIKTVSGIGVGNSLPDIITAYRNYFISYWPGKKDQANEVKVYDNGKENCINFFLRNNRIIMLGSDREPGD